MKSIFVTAFQPFVSRNILDTGVLDLLLNRNFQVVIFVPKLKEAHYKDTYTHPRIVIVGLAPEVFSTRLERKLEYFANLLIDTNTMRFHRMIEHVRTRKVVRYLSSSLFSAFFSRSSILKALFRILDYRLNSCRVFDPYFERYRPFVVFAPDVFEKADVALLKTAKRRRVPCVGMVRSWDNPTTKGLLRAIPDRLIVQNQILRQESRKLHDVSRDRIRVSGIPHYDYYREYKPVSRAALFQRIGASENRKLVLVSPAGEKFIRTDWQILEILRTANQEGLFRHKIQFLVRVHPTNRVDFKDFKPDESFIIEEPGIAFEGMVSKQNELGKEGMNHIIDTLTHSDVVINVLSSIAIDAAVLGRPVITIGFDGWEKDTPFIDSVKLRHRETNMAKLLKVGATPVAKSRHELIDLINRYLDDPGLHQDRRAELVRQQCLKVAGSGEDRGKNKIVSFLLEQAQ